MRHTMCNHNRSLTKRWLNLGGFCALVLGALVCGCMDYFRYHLGGGPQTPDRPREAYYGTGIVTAVEIQPPAWKVARVDFGRSPPPREKVHLLVMHTDTMVGKAMARDDQSVWILEGTPEVGDLVIGIQNES